MQTGKPIGRIEAPAMDGLDIVVVQGTDAASLEKGPGHYPETPFPGQGGTVGIAGHRTTYLAPFRHIDSIEIGDPIVLEMPYGNFIYRVTKTAIVDPSDVGIVKDVGYERARAQRLPPALQRRPALRHLRQAGARAPLRRSLSRLAPLGRADAAAAVFFRVVAVVVEVVVGVAWSWPRWSWSWSVPWSWSVRSWSSCGGAVGGGRQGGDRFRVEVVELAAVVVAGDHDDRDDQADDHRDQAGDEQAHVAVRAARRPARGLRAHHRVGSSCT